MTISHDVTGTLRAETKHHEPVILEPRSPDGVPRVYGDSVVPTLNTCGGGQRVPCIIERTNNNTDDQHEQST